MQNKKLCLHLACGTVYLRSHSTEDWINIDTEHENTYLSDKRPDLVEQNGTDMEHYYKQFVGKEDFMTGKLHEKEVVCDRLMDVQKLDYEDNSVDKIVGIQIVEHFDYEDGKNLLKEWFRVLKSGGSVQIHVPDMEGIIASYGKEDLDWMIRQIYGSQKNKLNVHKSGYTNLSLTKILKKVGFSNVVAIKNIHSYPSVCLRAYK